MNGNCRKNDLDGSPCANVNRLISRYVLLVAILVTLVINVFNLDIFVSGLFYDRFSGEWLGEGSFTCHLIYSGTHIPAVILILCVSFYLLKSLFQRTFDQRTQLGCFLLCGLVLGPGLVVNWTCKDLIGRPRPNEIHEFSGEQTFTSVGVLGPVGFNSSFPCGHASMGFFLMLPGLLSLRLRQKKHARLWIAIGLVAGSVIGLTRVLQGDHYLSDVIWSGVLVYYTAVLLLKYTIIIESDDELTPFGRNLWQFVLAVISPFNRSGVSSKTSLPNTNQPHKAAVVQS